MTDKHVLHVFEELLESIADGESLEAALEAYPQYADELRPLLQTAIAATRSTPALPSSANMQKRSLNRMLHYAAQLRPRRPARPRPRFRWRFSMAAVIAVVMLFLSSTGIWVGSAQSLPGDPLYGLKRTFEDWNRTLVSDKETRYELDLTYRQRRVDEVLRLLALDRVAAVAFEGALNNRGHNLWDVEDIAVIVHADTALFGPFHVGDKVDVKGVTTLSGAVLATTIELRRYTLIGVIESQEGTDWVITNRLIDVSDAILPVGTQPGSWVEVEVFIGADRTHKALRINLLASPVPTDDDDESDKDPSVEIEVEQSITEREIEGKLESMSASAIIVNGQTILLYSDTEVDGVLATGVHVKVDARQLPDGSLIALELKIKDRDDLDTDDTKIEDDESADGEEEDDEPDEEDEEEEDD